MDMARIETLLRAGPPLDPGYEPVLAADGAPSGYVTPTQVVRLVRPERRRRASGRQALIAAAVVVILVGAGLLVAPLLLERDVAAPKDLEAPVIPSPIPRSISGVDLEAITVSWANDLGAGVSDAVVVDGRVFLAGSPVHPSTGVIRLGPVSRLYLVAIALQLVDEGRLSLDDPLSKFVPDWPNGAAITVRMLLDGSSGVASFGDPIDDLERLLATDPGRAWNAADALAIARSLPPRFSPGTEMSPADTDDALLAEVIDRTTGEAASAAVRDRLLAPLGLSTTFADGEPVPPAGASQSSGAGTPASGEMVRGHRLASGGGGTIDDLSPDLLAVLGPARGMAGTVSDVAKWSDRLHHPGFLADGGRRLMDLPYELGGFGGISTCPCVDGAARAIVVSGSAGAYSALVAWFPDTGATIAVLVDRVVSPGDLQTLLERIDALVPGQVPQANE
jgi:CubicO group peptidase (beta-lactamase class C family)